MNTVRTMWALILLFVSACAQPSATRVIVKVQSDLVPGIDVDAVLAETFEETGRNRAGARTFAVSTDSPPPSGKKTLPFSFSVERNTQDRFLLVLSGLKSDKTVVQQRTLVQFRRGETLHIEAFLGSTCLEVVCAQHESCYSLPVDSPSAGKCTSVREAEPTSVEPSTRDASGENEASSSQNATSPHSDGGLPSCGPGETCDAAAEDAGLGRDPCAALEGEPAPCSANQECTAGADGVTVFCHCAEGYADCSGEGENDCAVDLQSDAAHCGKCGMACADGLACNEGVCEQGLAHLVHGGHATCALTTSGEVWCAGPGADSAKLTLLSEHTPADQLGVGRSHTCVRSGENVRCWGDNRVHQLEVPSILRGLTDIAAGGDDNCAVINGRVHCWGGQYIPPTSNAWENSVEEANGSPYANDRTVMVSSTRALDGALMVSMVQGFGCALMRTGSIQCWEDSGDGAYGLSVPVKGAGGELYDAMSLCTGETFDLVRPRRVGQSPSPYGCAVGKEGDLACWGRDPAESARRASAGSSDSWPPRTEYRTIPLPSVAEVACGLGHACARTEGGAVYCWGENSVGQLGIGTNEPYRVEPTRVVSPSDPAEPLSGVVSIYSGAASTCAQTRTGHLYCWGSGVDERLSFASEGPFLNPQEVLNPPWSQ